MKQNVQGYMNPRVLKLNVGYLLASGSGYSRDSYIDLPPTRVADDLNIEYLRGDLRLSRTKEGILLQAQLEVSVKAQCYRCLTDVNQSIHLNLEELYTTSRVGDIEFVIDEGGILDLAPLLRAETLIEGEHRILCKTDCQGICSICGTNKNTGSCQCDYGDIDPRLAALKQLLD
jgi:uncharacterized protein